MKTNQKNREKQLWGIMLSPLFPEISFKEWEWEELDALNIMVHHIRKLNSEDSPASILLNNFNCSPSELRTAIATQLTCADWSSGMDAVQHFATFMLSGSKPMAKYTSRAIELLSEYLDEVKSDPDDWEPEEPQKLESAISFLKRFDN